MEKEPREISAIQLEENLKKAMTELLILRLLTERDYYIGELTDTLSDRSGGVLNVVFPYAAVYRMLEQGTIKEIEKRVAPDGRRRQYYGITRKGKERYCLLLDTYRRFSDGVSAILPKEGENHE